MSTTREGDRKVARENAAPASTDPRDICREVTHAARLLGVAIAGRLAEFGVTTGQLGALLVLYRRGEMTQAELTRAVGVEQPTMANTLRRMERDGLVRRDADPSDGRRAIVSLTPAAQAVRDDVQALRGEIANEVLSGFTEDELVVFQNMVGRLVAGLEQLTR